MRAYPTSFTPAESNFRGVRIEGVRFVVTNRELFDSTRLGLELAAALEKLYPGKIDFSACARLIGSDDVIRRLEAGEDPARLSSRATATPGGRVRQAARRDICCISETMRVFAAPPLALGVGSASRLLYQAHGADIG